MKHRFVSISIFVLLGIGMFVAIHGAANPVLSQAEIETRAIAYARTVGLEETPKQITSKQVTLGEYRIRLDPSSVDS